MTQPEPHTALPREQVITQKVLRTLKRFTQIEANAGVALLLTAVAALVWANSPWANSYLALWSTPLGVSLGSWEVSQSLQFWINDAMMTLFFLVVGMEIRYEIHAGSLSNLRQAGLPVSAALGGVVTPALIYLAFNWDGGRHVGWAVPAATDIAFAVGLLALLGRGIPHAIRIFLLALAIIDDMVAVLIIAVFYTTGLDYSGFVIAGGGVLMVLAMQRMGIGLAWAYVVPGLVVWLGILTTGVNPTLAGVLLGLLTPVTPRRSRVKPINRVTRFNRQLLHKYGAAPEDIMEPLGKLRIAQRELLPPVIRVQASLDPWVAFAIMPIFAFANAGVSLQGIDFSQAGAVWASAGVALALLLGKPIGVLVASWLALRTGLGVLPEGITRGGLVLIGLFAGVGFTMSIFISTLAFTDSNLLNAAKLGVLLGSFAAGVLGLLWGALGLRQQNKKEMADAK